MHILIPAGPCHKSQVIPSFCIFHVVWFYTIITPIKAFFHKKIPSHSNSYPDQLGKTELTSQQNKEKYQKQIYELACQRAQDLLRFKCRENIILTYSRISPYTVTWCGHCVLHGGLSVQINN